MTAAPEGCCTLARRLSPEALASLDKALLEGTPYRKAREQAGLPPKDDSAVYKHRAHVLADAEASYEATSAAESQQNEAPGKQAEAITAAAAHIAAARPLIEEARRLRKRASKLLKRVEAGETDVDFKAASSLIGQQKGLLELEAKLLGEIKAPLAQVAEGPAEQPVQRFIVELATPERPTCPPSSDLPNGGSSLPTGDPATG